MKRITLRIITTSFTLLFAINFATKSQQPKVQNPPVTVEGMAGNRAYFQQLIINKKLQSAPRLGFFGVMNIQPEWESQAIQDYMVQSKLAFGITGNIDLLGGFFWAPATGVVPSVGATYTYGNPNWLIVIYPRIDIHTNPNAEMMSMVEYKPRLNENINLYTRAQGVYSYNLDADVHGRSYLMLRAGLTMGDISFGLANNIDVYGPAKHKENNFGIFMIMNLF